MRSASFQSRSSLASSELRLAGQARHSMGIVVGVGSGEVAEARLGAASEQRPSQPGHIVGLDARTASRSSSISAALSGSKRRTASPT